MMQHRSIDFRSMTVRLWISAFCLGSVLLACNLTVAEESTKSPEAAGLLWFSPETVDVEGHAAKSTVIAAAPPADDSPRVASKPMPELATTDANPVSDVVEDVFGDVLVDIGVMPSKDLAESPATDTSASVTAVPARDAEAVAAKSEPSNPESDAAISVETQAPARVIPSRVASLRKPVEDCLRLYEPKLLNSGEHSCWSMMHAFLGWGANTQIRIGSANGRPTSVLNWICQNQPCAGRRLFYVSDGRIKGREGPGYQGHAAQFLAMAAQTNTPREFPIRLQGNDFTIDELVKEEQLTCREPMELTFKLIGLSHYLDIDASWKNERGENWNLPRLIRAELAQPVNGAACGGTHRIMGLTYAVKKRKEAGKSIDGQWWRAEKFINDYYAYSLSLQNRDGSFSSDWFKRRGDWGGNDRKLQTTGHILEWMIFASSDEQLLDQRISRSVAFLTNLMVQHRYHDWEYGPKGHAVRALRLYHERVFGGEWNQPSKLVRRDRKPSKPRRSGRRR